MQTLPESRTSAPVSFHVSNKSIHSRDSLSHILECRLSGPSKDCVGVMIGNCAGEICRHFSTCFNAVMKDTAEEWSYPLFPERSKAFLPRG